MNVVLPWTQDHPEVYKALRAAVKSFRNPYVGRSDRDYFWTLSELWEGGEPFVIVEHDVIVRPNSINELEQCPWPWCAFAVRYGDGSTPGLGCAKFTAEVMRAAPDALDRVARMSDDEHPPMHWCRLDWWLQHMVLPGYGFTQHVHGPPLEHLRDYDGKVLPSHDCQSPGRVRTKHSDRICERAG